MVGGVFGTRSRPPYYPTPCLCCLRRKQRLLAALSASTALSLIFLVFHTSSSSSSPSSFSSSSEFIFPTTTYFLNFLPHGGHRDLPDKTHYVKDVIEGTTTNKHKPKVSEVVLRPASYANDQRNMRDSPEKVITYELENMPPAHGDAWKTRGNTNSITRNRKYGRADVDAWNNRNGGKLSALSEKEANLPRLNDRQQEVPQRNWKVQEPPRAKEMKEKKRKHRPMKNPRAKSKNSKSDKHRNQHRNVKTRGTRTKGSEKGSRSKHKKTGGRSGQFDTKVLLMSNKMSLKSETEDTLQTDGLSPGKSDIRGSALINGRGGARSIPKDPHVSSNKSPAKPNAGGRKKDEKGVRMSPSGDRRHKAPRDIHEQQQPYIAKKGGSSFLGVNSRNQTASLDTHGRSNNSEGGAARGDRGKEGRQNNLLLVLDYSRRAYFPWRTTNDECANYATRFLVGGRSPVVAMASFPGSGNTWLRYLAETLTGVFTGSVYHDEMLALKGLWGERDGYRQGTTLLQKTHSFPLLPEDVKAGLYRGGDFRFLLPGPGVRKVVVLLRSPWESILALRHYHAAGHTGFASSAFFRGPMWNNFTIERAELWVKLYTAWLSLPHTHTLVLHYEHLQHRLEQEAVRLMTFLGLPLDYGRLDCLIRYPEGRFRRPKYPKHLQGYTFPAEAANILHRGMAELDSLLMKGGHPLLPSHLYSFTPAVQQQEEFTAAPLVVVPAGG